MVRLKAHPELVIQASDTIFQFQYGSIKSPDQSLSVQEIIRFQFQYGSIKRHILLVSNSKYPYFNSNMVRLKDSEEGKNYLVREQFQFQYGSIKRYHKKYPYDNGK